MSDNKFNVVESRVAPQPPVSRALDLLQVSISDLENHLDALVVRLEPALGPSYPAPAERVDGEDRPEVSNLAHIIGNQSDRVNMIFSRISNIIDRIEL